MQGADDSIHQFSLSLVYLKWIVELDVPWVYKIHVNLFLCISTIFVNKKWIRKIIHSRGWSVFSMPVMDLCWLFCILRTITFTLNCC